MDAYPSRLLRADSDRKVQQGEKNDHGVSEPPGVPQFAGKKSQRGEALLVTLPRSRPFYDDVCHLDHMSASAVARGNSQSAEGPAVHVPLSL